MLHDLQIIMATIEPTATRPFLLSTLSSWHTYSFDQVKNVTELFDASGNIAATYDYAPFGALVSSTGNIANPITFSSEIYDAALGMQYYNWRLYNPLEGRLFNRDPIHENGGLNLYWFVQNSPLMKADFLGLKTYKVPDCTYEVLVGHGLSDGTIRKYGGKIPQHAREKSKVPADIRLGKNSAATVVACNDLWYILIRDEDGWVYFDGGIPGYDRAQTEIQLLQVSDKMQSAYDAAVNEAKKAVSSDKCACKSGIEVKVTCFFTLTELYAGTTGDVREKCKLRTTIKE